MAVNRLLPLLLLPLLSLVAVPVTAAGSTTRRVSTLVVYGDDPCPQGAADEVVVCARQPENERYRIPKRLRVKPYNAARDGSWAGTAKVLDAAGQENIPGSCSANGTGGQTGCWQRFIAQANADQAAVPPAGSSTEPR